MKLLTFISLIVLLQSAFAQLRFPGECPRYKNPLEKSFKFNKWLGLWYADKLYKIPTVFRCTRGFYVNNENGTFTLYDIGNNKYTGKPIEATYEGKILDGPNLNLLYNADQKPDTANFIVVGTDYINFTVVYSCKQINKTQHEKNVFIFSRQWPMKKKYLKKAYAAVKNVGADVKLLIDYDQKNCYKK